MKMYRTVEVALNGDADDVQPAVRRTLYSMANELDEWQIEMLHEVRSVKRLLIGLTSTVVTGLLVAVANILLAL